MEESFSWKIIYLAAIFSLIVLGIAYYLISPRDAADFSGGKVEKIAEFKNTRVEGRKEGKRVWEFFAREGWTGKNQEITHLTGVDRGFIYQNGRAAVADLTAPRATVFRRTEVVEAFGGLKAYFDLGKFSSRPKTKSEWLRLRGERIRYTPSEKKSELEGGVTLVKRDSTIKAEKINIDHERKIASISEKIKIIRKDGVISSDQIEYLGEEEQMNASGHILLNLKENSIRTRVKSDRATLFADSQKDITLAGSLEAVQGKKIAVAAEGVYSRKQKGLLLKGGTKTVIEKAGAILREETAKKLRSSEQKEILREKTVVTANEIFFSTQTGDGRAAGSVEVIQKGREARADTAFYDDKNELMKLSGNVFVKKGEEWIKARSVVISVKKETFEAVGAVEGKFKL